MEAFLTSTALVAIAEIGDKTQLLAILLATRYRRPLPIVLGILVATAANHFLAAALGHIVADQLDGPAFRYAIAIGFIAMAAWALVPDKVDEGEVRAHSHASIFVTTAIAFFLVEMGDKTQVATAALGAHFPMVSVVTAGTTLGMMIANVPAVYLGDALIKRVPLAAVRYVAAALFLSLGLWMLASLQGWL